MRIGISGNGRLREQYPSSREAVERGCICCPVENRHGEGELFHPNDECPLHGFEAVFGSFRV